TTGPATLAAEWLSGKTTVGFPGGTFSMDLNTVYLLGSYKPRTQRISVRIEQFQTHSHNAVARDFTKEHRHAITVAWFHEPNDRARFGLEYVKADAKRPENIPGSINTGGSTLTAEVRYHF